jgi:hypothetical protein
VTIEPLPTENDSQFRIAATEGIRERRTRILKHGDTFAVLNDFGDMTPDPGSPDGLYHRDTRFLSKLELRLNGHRPLLLSSTPVEDNSFLPVDLANTDSIGPDGISLHRDFDMVKPPPVRLAGRFFGTIAFYGISTHRNMWQRSLFGLPPISPTSLTCGANREHAATNLRLRSLPPNTFCFATLRWTASSA